MEGRRPVETATWIAGDTDIPTSSYATLTTLSNTITHMDVFNYKSQFLKIGTGAKGSETALPITVFPTGLNVGPIYVTSGTRIGVQAVTTTATTGRIVVNFYA